MVYWVQQNILANFENSGNLFEKYNKFIRNLLFWILS